MHSADDSMHSADDSMHSADDTTHSADDTTHSADDTTHSADDTTHSADDSMHSADVLAHRADFFLRRALGAGQHIAYTSADLVADSPILLISQIHSETCSAVPIMEGRWQLRDPTIHVATAATCGRCVKAVDS
jgi:translation initiation factor 2B subunit (eIF-2B alpha/beta/delta family)